MEICEACGRSYELPADVQHTFHGGLCPKCAKDEALQEAEAQNHDDEDDSWKYEGLEYCQNCGAHEDNHDPEYCLMAQDAKHHERWIAGLRQGFAQGQTEFLAYTGHTWFRSQRCPDQIFSIGGEDPCHCVCLSCGVDWVGDPGWHACSATCWTAEIPMPEVVVDPQDARLLSWEWR